MHDSYSIIPKAESTQKEKGKNDALAPKSDESPVKAH